MSDKDDDDFRRFRDKIGDIVTNESREFDKHLIALNSGFIVLSMTVTSVLNVDRLAGTFALWISWGASLLSIFITIVSIDRSVKYCKEQIDIVDERFAARIPEVEYDIQRRLDSFQNNRSITIMRLNRAALICFIIAAFSLMAFSIINFEQKGQVVDNGKSKECGCVQSCACPNAILEEYRRPEEGKEEANSRGAPTQAAPHEAKTRGETVGMSAPTNTSKCPMGALGRQPEPIKRKAATDGSGLFQFATFQPTLCRYIEILRQCANSAENALPGRRAASESPATSSWSEAGLVGARPGCAGAASRTLNAIAVALSCSQESPLSGEPCGVREVSHVESDRWGRFFADWRWKPLAGKGSVPTTIETFFVPNSREE